MEIYLRGTHGDMCLVGTPFNRTFASLSISATFIISTPPRSSISNGRSDTSLRATCRMGVGTSALAGLCGSSSPSISAVARLALGLVGRLADAFSSTGGELVGLGVSGDVGECEERPFRVPSALRARASRDGAVVQVGMGE